MYMSAIFQPSTICDNEVRTLESTDCDYVSADLCLLLEIVDIHLNHDHST